MITFACLGCAKIHSVPDGVAAAWMKCSKCNTAQQVPRESNAVLQVPDPLAEAVKSVGAPGLVQMTDAERQRVLADVLPRIKAGQPTQFSYCFRPEHFENRVLLTEAMAAEGTLPVVTLIVLDPRSSKAGPESILLQTGVFSEYLKYSDEKASKERRDRVLPGKTWDDFAGAAISNFSLPGSQLDSLRPFEKIVSHIDAGQYIVRSVIALDGVAKESGVARRRADWLDDHGEEARGVAKESSVVRRRPWWRFW